MSAQRDRVMIFDTTLRDGEQSPGCSMAQPEKLRVARALADRIAVAIGAADRERNRCTAAVLLLGCEQVGELRARQRLAALVEDIEVAVRGERRDHAGLVLRLVHGKRAVRT